MRSLLASQRLLECAKICVKKCKRAKNWKIDFADVCIYFFLKAVIFADFCLFYVPTVPLSYFSYPKTNAFTLIYQPLIFIDSNFRIGK